MMLYVVTSTLLLLACHDARGMLRSSSGNDQDPVWRLEKPRYSNDWAVEVSLGEEHANQLANKYGFVNMGQIGNLHNRYHFQLMVNVTGLYNKSANYRHIHDRSIGSLAEIGAQPTITDTLLFEDNVVFAEQQCLKKHTKKDYRHPTDPKFGRQWSLLNTGQIGYKPFLDLNVERAWMQSITGSGIVVSFVDDGLEHTHPDLISNYVSYASYDFVNHDSDPTPSNYYGKEPDRHGTSCAGEVGMAKDNNNCGVGVAYECSIGGLKLDLGDSNDINEANALSYQSDLIDVYSNSWGPSDYGFVVDGPGTQLTATFEQQIKTGRNGKGSIYIWASGNGGTYYDSCAADGYASSIYTIAVGSADQTGRQADYDEFCSAKMAVTFSYDAATFSNDDEFTAYNQVTTTTLNGECADDFTGTSASTPLMSGVAALTLQANGNLTWRDMQYLIAYTSNTDKLVDGDWQTNGAGLKVSHKFGFGAIDAEAMVSRARRWINVPDKMTEAYHNDHSQSTIQSHDKYTSTFVVYDSKLTYLEHVVVFITVSIHGFSHSYDYDDFSDELNVIDAQSSDKLYDWLADSHPRRGDIKIQLMSPQGTVSTLLPYRKYDFVNTKGYSSWPFMSVQHWGEDPNGDWTLSVWYNSPSGYVSTYIHNMTLHGTTTVPHAVSMIPESCHPSCGSNRRCSGETSFDCDTCRDYRIASSLQCVSVCPNTTYVHNKYCLTGSPQPDHIIIYPHSANKGIYIGAGVAGAILFLFIAGCVIGVLFVCQRQRRSTRRGFQYSPIAPTPTTV